VRRPRHSSSLFPAEYDASFAAFALDDPQILVSFGALEKSPDLSILAESDFEKQHAAWS
jgi:hypothetical protein